MFPSTWFPASTNKITSNLVLHPLSLSLSTQGTLASAFKVSFEKTMKQKVLIKVLSMDNHKSRSKALKIAVGCSGVESAGFKGDEKDQIEIIGEGVDAAEITTLLRKNVGHAELVSVGPVEYKNEKETQDKNEKETQNKNDKETPTQDQGSWYYCEGVWHYCEGTRVPYCPICGYRIVNQYEDPYCSIM